MIESGGCARKNRAPLRNESPWVSGPPSRELSEWDLPTLREVLGEGAEGADEGDWDLGWNEDESPEESP